MGWASDGRGLGGRGLGDSASDNPSIAQELYPEVRAGGFSHVDGNVDFYGRVNALLAPDMTIVDFGAGRGKDATDDPVAYRRGLRNLRGKVAEVVGVDTDPVVLTNVSLDRAIVIDKRMNDFPWNPNR